MFIVYEFELLLKRNLLLLVLDFFVVFYEKDIDIVFNVIVMNFVFVLFKLFKKNNIKYFVKEEMFCLIF